MEVFRRIASIRSTSPKLDKGDSPPELVSDNPLFAGGRGSPRSSDLSQSSESDTDITDIKWCKDKISAQSKKDLAKFLKSMKSNEYKTKIFPYAQDRFVTENFLFLQEVAKFKRKKPSLEHAKKIDKEFISRRF